MPKRTSTERLPVGPGRAARQFVIEARKAQTFGKPLAAALMLSLARVLPRLPVLHAYLETWPGDLASDAVAFRVNAALHALVRAGKAPDLAPLYGLSPGHSAPSPEALDRAVIVALHQHQDAVLASMAHPTQTNEAARVIGLVATLLELGRERALPCEILELGASAGLNLNFPHYTCRIGGLTAGAAQSTVMLQPEWRGREVAGPPLEIARAIGVDLHPLDVRDVEHCERLQSYIWPGEHQRSARLEAAIGLARQFPPLVAEDEASRWLTKALSTAQPSGVRRVVFHSMVLQYVDMPTRAAIDAALAAAGARASVDAPLVRVGIEWRADRACVELHLTQWDGSGPTGKRCIAAICHPYGEWFDWRGLGEA